MRQLCIIGAGGHGKVVAELADSLNQYNQIHFFDDAIPAGTLVAGHLVQGSIPDLHEYLYAHTEVFVAIGNNAKRHHFMAQLTKMKCKLATFIHPTAYISPSAFIGPGVVVLSQAVVNTDARVGAGAIINTAAIVEHDCLIDECAHIATNATLAGRVTVGTKTWIGIGSSVIEGTRIGKGVKIGAGSVVLDDVPDYVTAVGIPAKIIYDATSD